jgi:hypothetical protein
MAEETKALTTRPKAFSLPAAPDLAGFKTELGPIPKVADYQKVAEELKTSKDVGGEQFRKLERLESAEQDIGAAQLATQQFKADTDAAIASQTRQGAQDIEAGLDLIRQRFPHPQFHPTQENVQSMATLFSLIGLVGTGMGGGGKMSAMNALVSMNGMLKGWQQGRKDLYEREKVEFDKNMARVKAILDDAYKDADRAYKTLAYNREEAQALAGQSAAKLGGQVGKQILEKQGLERYVDFLKGLKKDLENAEERASAERIQQARNDAADKRQLAQFAQQDKLARDREAAAERRLRRDMDHRERLAAIRASQPKGQGSAANTRYAFNMAEAFSQAAQDLVNITNMPRDTVMGNFAELAGKSGDSLKQGLTAALGRKMTSQDERMFAQLVAGLDQNMARTLGGGYANSGAKHAIEAYKQQLPRAGDSAATSALFLARFKQELGIFADVFEAHPGSSDKMAGKVNNYMNAVNKAIPYNVNDVLDATRGSRQTINQQFEELATPRGDINLPVDSGNAASTQSAGRATLRGRAIVVRGNKWVFEDDGTEAK